MPAVTLEPVIDRETSQLAQAGLLSAVTSLLEAALDNCTGANAPANMSAIGELSRDAAELATAIATVRKRSMP